MKSIFGNWTTILGRCSRSLFLLALIPGLGIYDSALAAERVYASYSALERSISVSSLEKYAIKGVISEDLAVYTQYFKADQLEEFRRILLSPIKVDRVAVSQFLYTPQGEFLLKRLGEVIKNESGQEKSGFHALRSALILAAAEPEGLTLLNLMRKYPSPGIHINLSRILGIAAEWEQLVNQTNHAIDAISKRSLIEAANIPAGMNFSRLPSLQRQGNFAANKHQFKFFDASRRRVLMTDVYLPNTKFNLKNQIPAIVISHGLGSDSTNFRYLANYLVSHGFAVVVPNHPGSDTKQIRSLLDGSASELAQPEEFYNGPLDVTYILDELERINRSDSRFGERLNLQQVGLFGQSFGGYTVLALAGAKIDYKNLQESCQERALRKSWNMSLLLQCRAKKLYGSLQRQGNNLRDERVKAVIAVNPLTSAIFGENGLKSLPVPVMIVASSDDTITPALYEQILPFSWLNNSRKYLALLTGATHFSAIGNSASDVGQLPLPSEVVGEDPVQTRSYVSVLSLPFFQTYVASNRKYANYLNAAYAKAISKTTVQVNLVKSLNQSEIELDKNKDKDKE
ncbi:MAG: alpha/beta fold hydrolase [Mastigocoleus sp. MO_167.B18]|nr:alpha/beta fold hydrolase [Mastigocoleus sp. MO_167.B18]